MLYSVLKFLPGKCLTLSLPILLTGCISNNTALLEPDPQADLSQQNKVPATQQLYTYISTLNIPKSSVSTESVTALELSKKGQHKEALSLIKAVTKKQPSAAHNMLIHGIVLYNKGDILAAEAAFTSLIKKHPEFPEAYNNLAVIYADKGMYPQAIDTLQKSFQQHASYKNIYDNLKSLYATLASEAYNKALDLNEQPAGPQLALLEQLTEHKSQQIKETIKPVVGSVILSKSTATDKSNEQQKAVHKHLENWAFNWSQQDPKAYIKAYTDTYRPDPKLNHQQWILQREVRLKKPQYIKIELKNIEVQIHKDNLAEAYFIQRYESDTYQDTVRKRIMLVKHDNLWKISLEQSLGLIE